MIELSRRYRSQEFAVLAVNVWDEPAEEVRRFVKEKGINYVVLLNGSEVAAKYGVKGIPASFHIDARGRIASSHEGAEDQAAMETRIKAILSRAP